MSRVFARGELREGIRKLSFRGHRVRNAGFHDRSCGNLPQHGPSRGRFRALSAHRRSAGCSGERRGLSPACRASQAPLCGCLDSDHPRIGSQDYTRRKSGCLGGRKTIGQIDIDDRRNSGSQGGANIRGIARKLSRRSGVDCPCCSVRATAANTVLGRDGDESVRFPGQAGGEFHPDQELVAHAQLGLAAGARRRGAPERVC